MIALFLGLTLFNILCLGMTCALGYAVAQGRAHSATYHQLAGIFATIACCAVHCVVFTYFIATAKWIRHAVDVKRLDPSLAAPTRSFKAQAFPAAIVAMSVVILTAIFGVLRLSYGISANWHHSLALLSMATNIGVAAIEFQAIQRNGRLIDAILMKINPA